MKKLIVVIVISIVLLFTSCRASSSITVDPVTEPTVEPTTEATTEPATEAATSKTERAPLMSELRYEDGLYWWPYRYNVSDEPTCKFAINGFRPKWAKYDEENIIIKFYDKEYKLSFCMVNKNGTVTYLDSGTDKLENLFLGSYVEIITTYCTMITWCTPNEYLLDYIYCDDFQEIVFDLTKEHAFAKVDDFTFILYSDGGFTRFSLFPDCARFFYTVLDTSR